MKLGLAAVVLCLVGLGALLTSYMLALNEDCGRELPTCPTSDLTIGALSVGGWAGIAAGVLLGLAALIRWSRAPVAQPPAPTVPKSRRGAA